MSERERIRLSFNLDNPRHVQALNQLEPYDGKQRSEYVIECILAMRDTERLEKMLIRILDERFSQRDRNSKECAVVERSMETQAEPVADALPTTMTSFLDGF